MRIVTYTPDMEPCLTRLLTQWEFLPYAQQRWGRSAAAGLCWERVAKTLADPSAQAVVLTEQDAMMGMGVLIPLPWDGEQIGITAGRIDYLLVQGDYAQRRDRLTSLLQSLLKHAERRNIHHLSARVDAGDLAAIHALEAVGMELMDGLLTFGLDLSMSQGTTAREDADMPRSSGAFRLRLATMEDAEGAAKLAQDAYRHDRFHADPAIDPERADELHACWVRNSCLGRAADGVIVAEDETGLLGFVTCKLNRDTIAHFGGMVGTIVLVAVGENARGRGVGKQATLAALRWMRAQGVEWVEVGTQIRNIAAGRLYESCGFRLSGSSLTFRKMLV